MKRQALTRRHRAQDPEPSDVAAMGEEPDLFGEEEEDGSKYGRLTLMEEVLLLGIKDRYVPLSLSFFYYARCSSHLRVWCVL